MTSWRSRATDSPHSTADAAKTSHRRSIARGADTYANFADLTRCETRGRDYTIQSRSGTSRLAVIAPHGGRIEAGTATLADAVAGDRHSFYAFKGIKPAGNAALHITSHHFDEPTGLQVVGSADVAVALHGHHDPLNEIVHIGGRNDTLRRRMRYLLTRAGFHVEAALQDGLRAVHPLNICNRCRSGRGVQIEITRALREKLFDPLFPLAQRSKTPLFHTFVQALRSALE